MIIGFARNLISEWEEEEAYQVVPKILLLAVANMRQTTENLENIIMGSKEVTSKQLVGGYRQVADSW